MGSMAGLASLSLYILSVIVTTPNLPPFAAISIAFQLNGLVMLGVSTGVAAQVGLTSYSKKLPCRLRASTSATTGSSALSAFFSFFSLVQVGCCGTWLYLLSLIPGILGVGLSGFVIQFSSMLAGLGLIAVAGSIGYTLRSIIKARQVLKQQIPASRDGLNLSP